jgi:hypothetical protein
MQQIPEEIQTMAWLLGESNSIESNVIDRSTGIGTDSSTIRNQVDQYLKLSRGQPPQAPQMPVGGFPYVGEQFPPVQHIQAPMPQYQPYVAPQPQRDENQLEFNLTPNQGDIIINLLKEISVKLTKQNNLLQSFNEKNLPKEDRIPVLTQKSGKNQ